ncbi:hypothetical protein MMC22_009227 [Lobaria immixta]|nr:hypothetical protein [Lobaria immixta]
MSKELLERAEVSADEAIQKTIQEQERKEDAPGGVGGLVLDQGLDDPLVELDGQDEHKDRTRGRDLGRIFKAKKEEFACGKSSNPLRKYCLDIML